MQNRLFPFLLLFLLGIGMVTGYEFMDGTLPAETIAYADFDLNDIKVVQDANAINGDTETAIALRDKNVDAEIGETSSNNYRVNVSLFASTKAPKSR